MGRATHLVSTMPPPYHNHNNNNNSKNVLTSTTTNTTGTRNLGVTKSHGSTLPSNTGNSSSNNNVIIPNRISNFQKSIDDGRCPTQVVFAETVSSGGSSLTSQPRPSSSSLTSAAQPSSSSYLRYSNHSHNNNNNNNTTTGSNGTNKRSNRVASVTAPTSPGRGGYHHNHSAVSESSVIFQKSAGLSKLLAPSSPTQQQQQLQSSSNSHNETATTSSTSSPTMTSTRYASAIRRNRMLQRSSLSPGSAVTTSVSNAALSVVPNLAEPTTVSKTEPNALLDRRSHQHRMLRQSRRPSSMQHRSSLSPPQKDKVATTTAHTLSNTLNTAAVVSTTTSTKTTTSPVKKPTATTVAAAMIAAAASRRLEKASQSPPSPVSRPSQNAAAKPSVATGTMTNRSMALRNHHHQQEQSARMPTSSMAQHIQQPLLSPTPRLEEYHHNNNNSTSTQQPLLMSGSPVARVRSRHLSPKTNRNSHYHHNEHVANENSPYHDVIDSASSLSPKDRYESIQQQQQQYQRQYDDDYERHHHHHHPQQPLTPPMVQRSAYEPPQSPELPSLIPAIGNDTQHNVHHHHHHHQQQQHYNHHITIPPQSYPVHHTSHAKLQPRDGVVGPSNFYHSERGSGGDVTPNHVLHTEGPPMAMASSSPGTSPYSHYPVPRSSRKSSSEYNNNNNINNRLAPRPKHPYSKGHPSRHRNLNDDHDGEEKKFSEAMHPPQQQQPSGLQPTTSSSDYETDYSRGADNMLAHQYRRIGGGGGGGGMLKNEPTFSNMSASQMTPDVAAFFEQSSGTKSRSIRDDDTYDYGDRDDDEEELDDDDDLLAAAAATGSLHDDTDSQGSLSYEQRRQKLEQEQKARAAAVAAAKAEMEGPFMKQDDVEHYRKVVDTPLGRTAAGVAAAATVGCVLLGPVGIILGIAAVGIGAGYMQIPEAQRQNMNTKVTDAMKNAQESAIDVSEKLSVNCLASYRDSGISEHVPVEMETCCVNLAGLDGNAPQSAGNYDDDASLVQDREPGDIMNNGNSVPAKSQDKRKTNTPTHGNWSRRKSEKISCLRKGKIIPVAQIHALDPSAQPRAWLDVLANADTSSDERIEATEEILILAKDKQKSRIFVDEGILDCLLWTIGRYMEKKKKGPGSELWAFPEIKPDEKAMVKLAANCCLTLGKSYCAAIHTEGDLLLMSLYDRGTVPEERQLAQMLMEVPHHTRSTKTDDPTIIVPGKESFALKQMTLSQAEELAAVITAIATGKE